MTICHILTYSYENGGTSQVVADLASYQTSKGDKVRILSTELPGQVRFPLPDGVELITFKPETMTRVIPLYSSEMYDYVEANDQDIDVYHLHCLWNYSEMLVDKLHLHHKTIVTIHGSLHPYTFKGLVYYKRLVYSKWFQKNFLQKVKVIHLLHEGEVKDITDYLGYAPDNLEVIPNGIALQSMPPSENRNRNEILYIGRLHHKKGLDILLPAFRIVIQQRPSARLLIAGPDDGMLDYIQEFVHKNGMEKYVDYLGTVTGNDKKTLFGRVGLFVLPTYSEGFSLAVMESLLYGLPAVVSDQTGLSPLLEKYEAAVVTGLSPEDFAAGVLEVMGDPALADKLSANGRKLLSEKLEKSHICAEFNRRIYDKFRG